MCYSAGVTQAMLRFFEERGYNIVFGEEDEEILKNTADFMSFSYYYTRVRQGKL